MAFPKINNKVLIVLIIILGIILFGKPLGLFSIFGGISIPIVTTTAACTGTLQGQPLSQTDCNGFGPTVYGSSSGGWAFSSTGEGTITLPQSSNSFDLQGDARGFGGSGTVKVFNYVTGIYEETGFTYDNDNSIGLETKNFGKNYLDSATSTIAKFQWGLSCSGQCARGIERLAVIQYDSIVTATTTTSTTTTTSIGAATSTILVTSTSTVAAGQSTTSTISGSYTPSGPTTTTTIQQQQGLFNLGSNSTILLILVIAGIAGFIYYQQRK